jgi:hypothetical protein
VHAGSEWLNACSERPHSEDGISVAGRLAGGGFAALATARTSNGSIASVPPGHSAAPPFHNIASWLLQRGNVPLSPDPGPPLTLQAL